MTNVRPAAQGGKTRFGEFEIDRSACALLRNGQRIPLQIQPFRVLETLVDSAGEVVTRAALCARVWPETVYIDVDRGLNNAVNRLRQALGDSGDTPIYIETLPRIGYRFIHPLDSPPLPSPPEVEASQNGRALVRTGMAALAALIVAGLVAGAVQCTGNKPDTAAKAARKDSQTQVAAARDAYLRGLKLLDQRNKESLRLAIRHFQSATERDPTFAEAFAMLATAYAGAGGTTHAAYMNANDALQPALAAAERALQLDPNLGKAHVALARVLNSLQPKAKATDLAIEQSFRRGLELDPSDADAHLQFGNFLAKRNRGDEALAQFRIALDLDPLSPSVSSRLGQELMAHGKTAEGLNVLRRTVELDPFQFNARMRLGWGYLVVGDVAAAEREFAAADRISPDSLPALSSLAYIAARQGDTARARKMLDDLAPIAQALGEPFPVAIVYVGLKDRENALKWLALTAQQTRTLEGKPTWGLHAPFYDWLRDDPRFRQLQQQVNTATTQ